MKKISVLMALRVVFAAGFATLISCTGNFDEYNHNPNETTDDQLQRDNYNVGSKLLQLQNEVVPTQEHLYQFTELLVGHCYGGYEESTPDSWVSRFSSFNPPVNWIKAPFSDVLTDTYPPYRGILKATDDEVVLSLANLLRVAIMHRVTDQYGPIPYSKVVEDRREQLTVAYDSQQEVYTKMFEELDAAIEVLNANVSLSAEAFGDYDLVYYGNIGQWVKFANSLKLRMAMRLTYVDEAAARAKATEAIAGGVIEENKGNALFHIAFNRCAMIWNDWQDHVASGDLESYMNGYNDPRRAKMFTVFNGNVQGLRIGVLPTSKDLAKNVCSFPIISDTDPFLWINAAEVAFLKAEYALRWGTMAEAGEHYRNGVRLSFEEHDAGSADTYLATEAKPQDYVDRPSSYQYPFSAMSTITPVWSDNDNLETALERIITQKWIAIYPLGNEAWAEYRRTGYPRLAPVPDDYNKSGGTVNPKHGARRLPYPTEEYAENRDNVTDAVATKLGGPDNAGTRVWWDKKPLN